jgi:hypothetical protein
MTGEVFLLALLLLLAAVAAQEPMCYMPGQCAGIVVGFPSTDTYNDCLDVCKNNTNCKFFTHYLDTAECLEFYDCPSVDTACENCFSGQVECLPTGPECDVVGFCNGHLVATDTAETADDCLLFCQATEGCAWFSYSPDTGNCVLTEDCLFVDDSCSACVSGERDCHVGSSE